MTWETVWQICALLVVLMIVTLGVWSIIDADRQNKHKRRLELMEAQRRNGDAS